MCLAIRGNIGITGSPDREAFASQRCNDIHDAFEVVVPYLPFEDSFSQDFIRRGWDLDFFNEGVVPIQRYGQYQVQAAIC